MDDLYSDLPEDTTDTHITKLENEISSFQIKIRDLEKLVNTDKSEIANIQKLLEAVREENLILRANMSSLYRTAKAEIIRKNKQIEEYRNSSTSRRCERCQKHRGDNLAHLKRSNTGSNKIPNESHSSPMRTCGGTGDESYQDELSNERNTLQILIDEILRELSTDTGARGYNRDSYSPLAQRNGLSRYYSDISSYASSDDDLAFSSTYRKSKKIKKK